MQKTGQSRIAGAAAAVTLAIVAGYVVISGSFTFPAAPTNAVVADGFAPYFSQRWDVFAPNMLRVNSSLQIQVQWREETGLVHSDWVDVSDIELGALDHIPTPSRVAKSSVNAATTYLTRFDELSEAQQSRVQDTFIERTGDGGFRAIPDARLVEEIQALGDDDAAVIRLIRYDYMLTRFTAAFGEAYFGHPVERVRWRIQFSRPNDFEHRDDPVRQFKESQLEFGWRQTEGPPDSRVVATFADVIERYRS